MTFEELLDKITPYAKLPRGYTWDMFSAPICPHCSADLDSIGVSRLPMKTGLRGNPTLMCRACGTQWSFPKLRVGGPANAVVGLSERQIQTIYDNIKSLGDSPEAHRKNLGAAPTFLPEIRAILKITPQLRATLESEFGTVSVEDLAATYRISVPTITALYRGFVVRERCRRAVR